MQLNNDEIRRYSRHLILPEVGMAGQKKIRSTSVLCIGAGGLGLIAIEILKAMGGLVPRSVIHVQIEKAGRLEFGAYDNFSPDCLFFGRL